MGIRVSIQQSSRVMAESLRYKYARRECTKKRGMASHHTLRTKVNLENRGKRERRSKKMCFGSINLLNVKKMYLKRVNFLKISRWISLRIAYLYLLKKEVTRHQSGLSPAKQPSQREIYAVQFKDRDTKRESVKLKNL